MSIQEFLSFISQYSLYISIYFVIIPILAWIFGRQYKKSRRTLLTKILSVLVYAVCIPGMIALVLIAYTLFFTRQNLLDVNIVVYFFPVLSMIMSLIIISRFVHFKSLPGFDRLSGLMLLIAIVFLIVLGLYKMRLLVGFFGSLQALVVIAIVLYFVINWAIKKAFR